MMKLVVSAGALMTLFATSLSATASQTADLEIEVRGMETATGTLMIALFDSRPAYLSEQPIATRKEPVTDSTITIRFSNLVLGEYSAKVFHDENDNGTLDLGALGIPSEPYGFSNNASDPFSAPEWDETKFDVQNLSNNHVIKID